jgi:hypothetical protein
VSCMTQVTGDTGEQDRQDPCVFDFIFLIIYLDCAFVR